MKLQSCVLSNYVALISLQYEDKRCDKMKEGKTAEGKRCVWCVSCECWSSGGGREKEIIQHRG